MQRRQAQGTITMRPEDFNSIQEYQAQQELNAMIAIAVVIMFLAVVSYIFREDQMSNIKPGDRALFGKNKEERIFIAEIDDEFLAVSGGWNEIFEDGKEFKTFKWNSMEELPKPKERRYRWLLDREGYTQPSLNFMSDEYAEANGYQEDDWYKDEDDFIEVQTNSNDAD